jgi:hypothetical protein
MLLFLFRQQRSAGCERDLVVVGVGAGEEVRERLHTAHQGQQGGNCPIHSHR